MNDLTLNNLQRLLPQLKDSDVILFTCNLNSTLVKKPNTVLPSTYFYLLNKEDSNNDEYIGVGTLRELKERPEVQRMKVVQIRTKYIKEYFWFIVLAECEDNKDDTN